ncbi:F0F1 ATP synthase subunit epsilon [Pleomorphomonas diazotrophica]|uniref:ATP synthase epsilon chain n=1 Tax=Pleomorphomonas diazotrophica TaxID=1166257 RepID=A0A1I4RN58_9HYPH|nr:F0F1 ATP synthase subunit epsilon [Pleomorphomonas diazotrophica]PKR88163.1 F0F1 ATP synthase subunit epsilon [Pleomorphomonas diazotrophica]SFM53695.1 ATP synthase F1 subcomplex epsilon subunit [Pleomorphomonas diazotrophica]
MATFKFELVSPERLILSVDADQVDLPGSEGDFGVLAGHAPFLTTLKTGIVTVKAGGVASRIYVRGGFADVNAAGLSVLAEKAVPESEFGPAVAAAEIAAAESLLADAKSEGAKDRAVAALGDVKTAVTALA